MSRPCEGEFRRLGAVADVLREVVSERVYHVGQALEADPAFGSGSESSLLRELVFDGVGIGAGQAGVDFRSVSSGRELRPLIGGADRRYRVRRAKRRQGGSLVIQASAESVYAAGDSSELFPPEQWVFAWTVNADLEIDETIVAEVLGLTAGTPGRLILGDLFPVGGQVTGGPPSGFRPSDEGLPGFGDDDGLGDDEPGAAGPAAS